jgi:maleate cis-trans isomerase
MSLEYAPHGLVGLLVPQANTTVEAEFGILMPPGVAFISARLTSPQAGIADRMRDYIASLDTTIAQFANAPLGALALAVTGASYYTGVEEEDAAVARIEDRLGVPVVTAARAVRDSLLALSARRIGLVSPYPPDVTAASAAYWAARGFEVARIAETRAPDGAFHPIYALGSDAAVAALDSLDATGLDAVVMLGTGMPVLRPILARPALGAAPVTLSMLSLAWRVVEALARGRTAGAPPPPAGTLRPWIGGEGWRGRLAARLP